MNRKTENGTGTLITISAAGQDIKVSDFKKDYIMNIIESAQKCALINKIILFGSSLEERCGEKSDIDIAVFGDKSKYQALRSKQYRSFARSIYEFGDFQDYDILYFSSENSDENIMREILAGSVIYQREA